MAVIVPPSASARLESVVPERAVAGSMTLSDVPMRQAFQVVEVIPPVGQHDWAERLAEIGFLAGEQVQVLSRGVSGGDPLAVRVGTSTFALRRAEAACVRVAPRG